MKIKFSRNVKHIFSIILVLVGVILLFNTNNNPNPLIERILKPIKIGSGTVYYSPIFPLLFIYYGLKAMNKLGHYRWLHTRGSRIIITFIIIMLSNSLNVSAVKLAKGMYKDLNAIYYDRKYPNNQLEFKYYSDSSEILNCKIALENCSEETQEFYIRIQVPEVIKDSLTERELTAKSDDLKGDKKFVLHSKEKQIIDAVFFADLVKKGYNYSGSSSGFEINLVNDKGNVKFTRVMD